MLERLLARCAKLAGGAEFICRRAGMLSQLDDGRRLLRVGRGEAIDPDSGESIFFVDIRLRASGAGVGEDGEAAARRALAPFVAVMDELLAERYPGLAPQRKQLLQRGDTTTATDVGKGDCLGNVSILPPVSSTRRVAIVDGSRVGATLPPTFPVCVSSWIIRKPTFRCTRARARECGGASRPKTVPAVQDSSGTRPASK